MPRDSLTTVGSTFTYTVKQRIRAPTARSIRPQSRLRPEPRTDAGNNSGDRLTRRGGRTLGHQEDGGHHRDGWRHAPTPYVLATRGTEQP